jgi:hypothetical protein
MRLATALSSHVLTRGVAAFTLVMPGLDPGIHQSSHKALLRRRWIAGIQSKDALRAFARQ